MLLPRSRSLPRFARLVRWPTWLMLALPLSLGMLAVGDSAATAQVGLTWPDTAVDVSRYQTVEECLAATERVIHSEAKRERITTRVWHDTMPYDPRVEGPARSISALVTATAARCTARFRDPTELLGGKYDHRQDSVTGFPFLRYAIRLYLLAGRDADAAAFLARLIAAKPGSRRALEGVAIGEYKEALPMRTMALESLYTRRLRDSLSPGQRYDLYDQLWSMATETGDTTRVRSYREQLVAVWPKIPQNQRLALLAPRDVKPRGQKSFDPLREFYRPALLDTLRRHGTTRYVAAQTALFTQLTGTPPTGVLKFSKLDGLHKLVGQRAPAIVGDFWYRGDSTATRPSRGKVGLVVFVDPSPPGMIGASAERTDSAATFTSCFPHRNSREELEADYRRRIDQLHEHPRCWEIPAVLRRLAQRFPALEITLVTQTYGSLVYTAYPQNPAKEAELIRHWLHDVHRAPGALAVTTSSHGYRPEPDGRIARRLMIPNTANYFSAVQETWSYSFPVLGTRRYTPVIPNGAAFLVDHEGIIATAAQIERTRESQLAEVVDILLQRSGAAGGSGAATPAGMRTPSRP